MLGAKPARLSLSRITPTQPGVSGIRGSSKPTPHLLETSQPGVLAAATPVSDQAPRAGAWADRPHHRPVAVGATLAVSTDPAIFRVAQQSRTAPRCTTCMRSHVARHAPSSRTQALGLPP